MSEPEDIIADAVRHTAVAAQRLWRRASPRVIDEDAGLAKSKRRLELLLAATFGREIAVRVAQRPAPLSFLRKLYGPPGCLVPRGALPGTDGASVFLPDTLAVGPIARDRALRLLAMQQGARAVRESASARFVPAGDLARCLYEIGEAAEVDRVLSRALPGLRADLLALRAALLPGRPPPDKLRPIERRLEGLYRSLLEDESLRADGLVPPLPTPAATRAWAEALADRWAREEPARFRAFLRDALVGALRRSESLREPGHRPGAGGAPPPERQRPRESALARRPDVREDVEGEDDGEPGPWMIPTDEPHEHVEDPMGIQRPTDRGADGAGAADSLSELPEARVVSTPDRAEEIFVTDDPPQLKRRAPRGEGRRVGVVYPEWDHRRRAYDPAGATVWVGSAPHGSSTWASGVMRKRRALFEQVRRRFEALRARRVHLGRQEDGDALDLDALVEALADRAAGRSPDDRVYRTTRPLRRELAISLLVDVSGSTDAWVGEDGRIVDVEKEAVLLCCHALAALGDPFAIDAFSGEGAHGVSVFQVKGFDERVGPEVERRIAGLEPDNYTRAGAALRHVTAGLAARKERHRLLLLLSDGKPNDQDQYGGAYGVEDMRQAVHEAIGAGISVFCLTVDREAPSYTPRIFGPGRSTTLAHAKHLPVALVDVVRHLIRS